MIVEPEAHSDAAAPRYKYPFPYDAEGVTHTIHKDWRNRMSTMDDTTRIDWLAHRTAKLFTIGVDGGNAVEISWVFLEGDRPATFRRQLDAEIARVAKMTEPQPQPQPSGLEAPEWVYGTDQLLWRGQQLGHLARCNRFSTPNSWLVIFMGSSIRAVSFVGRQKARALLWEAAITWLRLDPETHKDPTL